jgi:hypothetical protein
VRGHTVLFVSALLHAERVRRGTRAGTRALSCFAQAIMVIRWLRDGTRVAQLAADDNLGPAPINFSLPQLADDPLRRMPTSRTQS